MATQSRRVRAVRTSFYGACLVVLFSAFECGRVAGPIGDLNASVQSSANGGTNASSNGNGTSGTNASTTSGTNASTTAGTNNNGQSNSNNNSGQNGSFIELTGVSPITAGA